MRACAGAGGRRARRASARRELYNKQKREGQYNLLVPLLYAPLAPLSAHPAAAAAAAARRVLQRRTPPAAATVRIGFRHNPPVRNALFGATVLAALTHAGVMMSRDSTM